MPTGVYERSPELKAKIKANLALGHSKKSRAKANKKLKALGKDEAWRDKVSEATKKAMHKPEVREKHLKGLKRAREIHGNNFTGGNGKEPPAFVKALMPDFQARGYTPELPIKTRGHGTNHKCPTCYKVDFGHPTLKIAYEIDGPSHRRSNRHIDQKKQEVLEALGWTVRRIKHK